MIIIKNAFRNMIRNKGKNILIGIIITIITLCTCIALAIHQAGINLIQTSKDTNPLSITFTLNMNELRNASDDEKNNFQSLTIQDIKKYGDSDLVKDYYYTLESSLSSNTIDAVEDNMKPDAKSDENSSENIPEDQEERHNEKMTSIGDFRITAYSNFSYLTDFVEGNKKITDGVMVTGDSKKDEIVISESLADDNNLKVGDEISFYLPEDENTTYTFTIIGIFEVEADDSSSNFMNMNALNSSNQMYTNINSLEKILNSTSTDDSKLVPSNGLNATFYLTNNNLVEKFEKEVQRKGLSNYYTISTNEDEILASLEPIQNIANFSIQFLVIILIIGIVVLTIINFLNIRDRKYEIGILRAIGMTKLKVTTLLILEIFFVALVSLILGTSTGTLLAQPVTNKILENEITSYTNNQVNTQNNFGGEGFEKPSEKIDDNSNNKPSQPNMDRNKQKEKQTITDYVDSLTVHITYITIIELFGISLLLIVGSSIIACLFVNKYNPNTILQNRN